MECKDMRQFLSEYLDAALAEDRKRLVEEHLSICQKCSEELESLRAYVKALNSLDKLEAPDNFLEKIHGRLKPRPWFKEIAHKLFVPVRIKIPLELVGAAAMVILILYIYNTVQPMREMAFAPFLVREPQTATEKALGKSADLAFKKKEKPAQPTAISKDIFDMTVKEGNEKPMEIALLIKLDKFREENREVRADEGQARDRQMSYSVKKLEEAAPSVKERELKEELQVFQPNVSAPAKLASKPKAIDKLKVGGISEQAAEQKEITKAKEIPDVPNKILSGLKDIIRLAEGKIISVEYKKDTSLPQFLNAEIPAANYTAFLEKLGQFGQVQEPLSPPAKKAKEPIQVRIGIILFR